MTHDPGNPFDKRTGEYLQEETSAPVIESDLNSTPPEKADELVKKKAELVQDEPAEIKADVKPVSRRNRSSK